MAVLAPPKLQSWGYAHGSYLSADDWSCTEAFVQGCIPRLAIARWYDVSAQPQWVERARAISQVVDQGLCAVLEIAERDGLLCVIREYRAGRSLAEIVAAAPLSPRAIAQLGVEVCAILGRLQRECGQPHGSVHAGNIILSWDHAVCITDAGCSRTEIHGLRSGSYEPPSEASDVAAVITVLDGLLGGAPVCPERDALGEALLRHDNGSVSALSEGIRPFADGGAVELDHLDTTDPRERWPCMRLA